jgi:hypothetical protein
VAKEGAKEGSSGSGKRKDVDSDVNVEVASDQATAKRMAIDVRCKDEPSDGQTPSGAELLD